MYGNGKDTLVSLTGIQLLYPFLVQTLKWNQVCLSVSSALHHVSLPHPPPLSPTYPLSHLAMTKPRTGMIPM